MGLFDLFHRKKSQIDTKQEDTPTLAIRHYIPSKEKLDQDGGLPWGWVLRNKYTVQQIEAEVAHFRKEICDANLNGDPSKIYAALKSYCLYLQDGEKYFSKIGECEGCYFKEYICNSAESERNIKDFQYYSENINRLVGEHKRKIFIENNIVPSLRSNLMNIIAANPDILQTDIYKHFDADVKPFILTELSQMDYQGLIIRERTGKSYILRIKG